MTDVVTSVMRINSTAANTAAAIVEALDKIRPIGLSVARSFWLPATFELRPPNTVTSAAKPPVVINDHVHLRESGPKITRPLIRIHASAPFTIWIFGPAAGNPCEDHDCQKKQRHEKWDAQADIQLHLHHRPRKLMRA